MYCTKCGAQIADDSSFCPKCGAPVVRTAGSATQSDVGGGENNFATQMMNTDSANVSSDYQENANMYSTQGNFFNQNADVGFKTTGQPSKKKKRHKVVIIVLIIVTVIVAAFILLAVIASMGDTTVDYEGIEFQIPNEWTIDKNSSSNAGLYFYKGSESDAHGLVIGSYPDYTSLYSGLIDTETAMDYITSAIQSSLGGTPGKAEKTTVAGYDAYVFEVTGADIDEGGKTVKGGYHCAMILNNDNNEMILMYEAEIGAGGKSSAESDLDSILKSATATKAENNY